jgi:hypothetical protein
MSDYLIGCLWGICILTAFVGWGTLISRLFVKEPIDWGLRAGWGLALTVCVGGVLNLAEVISPRVVLTWVIVGAAIWLIAFATSRWKLKNARFIDIGRLRNNRGLTLGSLLVCLLATLQYGAWVSTQIRSGGSYYDFPRASRLVFNVHDDYHAYFVYPRKMLAAGSLGEDPFSERRLNALGGQSFLQTLVLVVLPEENLHLLEPGVAILIVLGLLLGYFAERGTPHGYQIGVLLTFLVVPPPYMNISALMTGTVLFLALFRSLGSSKFANGTEWSRAVVVGMTAAALCALKSSFIPALLALLALWCVALVVSRRFERRVLLGAIAAAICMGLLVLPWMAAMYRAFNTPLFPLLGTGVSGPGSPHVVSVGGFGPSREVLQLLADELISIFVLVLIGFAWAVQRLLPADSHRHLLLAFLLSSLLGTLVVAVLLVGTPIFRFCYPFAVVAILVSMTDLLTVGSASGASTGTGRPLIAATLGAALLIGSSWRDVKSFYRGLPGAIQATVMNRAVIPPEERVQHRRMQSSIPPNQPLLTILAKPFLLDFQRNPVFIVDNPGSIPPSIPRFSEAEPLASYLLSRSIRYLAYSYRNEAGVPRSKFGDDDEDYYGPYFEYHDLLEALGRTRARIYDDGDIFVLDLSKHVPPALKD